MAKQTKKKKNKGFKKIAFLAVLVGICLLLKKLFEQKNEEAKQRYEKSEIKRFFSCFGALNETLKRSEVFCLKLTSYFSAVQLDLSNLDISSDLTIDISGFCSAVKVILPAQCNLVNVSDYKYSALSFPSRMEGDVPTVTLVGKTRLSALTFVRKAE